MCTHLRFLLPAPGYFVLQQKLGWAPRPINIHNSCVSHKHTLMHCDGESGKSWHFHSRVNCCSDVVRLFTHIHTLSWWWSETIPSPHLIPSSWLAAKSRLAYWRLHQSSRRNFFFFSDKLTTAYTLSLTHRERLTQSVLTPPCRDPVVPLPTVPSFLPSSFHAFQKLITNLKHRVLCSFTCPWVYSDS